MSKTLYTNAAVLPMTGGRLLRGCNILVEGKKIAALGPDVTDGDAEKIDCTGLYALPGFIEAHVHIIKDNVDTAPKAYIAQGVTSFRNMSGNMENIPGDGALDTYKVKQEIEEGKRISPTLVNTSNIFDGFEPHQQGSYVVTTIEMARKFMKEALTDRADQIKVYEELTPEVFDEICRMADEAGIKVVGHWPSRVDKEHFFEKAFSYEHTFSVDVDDAEMIKQHGTYWVPTLIVESNYDYLFKGKYRRFMQNPKYRFIPKDMSVFWEIIGKSGKLIKSSDELFQKFSKKKSIQKIRKFHKLGGLIAAGTDYPNPFVYPGFSLHYEFRLLKKCGMSNYEVLKAATINGAKVLEIEDRKGTLEAGKDADIVFLRKNPLRNIRNTGKIEKVLLRGRLFHREDLDRLLEEAVVTPL